MIGPISGASLESALHMYLGEVISYFLQQDLELFTEPCAKFKNDHWNKLYDMVNTVWIRKPFLYEFLFFYIIAPLSASLAVGAGNI